MTKTKNGRPEGFENVSLGVSDFEWFPNGKEFIVSSQSNLLPTGWEPVRLFKVPVDANIDSNKIKLFFTPFKQIQMTYLPLMQIILSGAQMEAG